MDFAVAVEYHKALMHRGMVPLKTGPDVPFSEVIHARKISYLVCRAMLLDNHDFEYVQGSCLGETGMLECWVRKLVKI